MALCNSVTITQRPQKGAFGGPYGCGFTYQQDGVKFSVTVHQEMIRTTRISANACVDIEKFWELFNKLDILMFVFNGEFFPICKVNLTGFSSNGLSLAKEKERLLQDRISCFESANFVKGSHSTFLEPFPYIDDTAFSEWLSIFDDLDISGKIALYAMSKMELPIDGKVALLIETFEPLADVFKSRVSSFGYRKARTGESQLGIILDQFITIYGTDVFGEELAIDHDRFIQIVVDSRNRVMHAKSKQNRIYFSGYESVLYSVKFSYLYRRLILELLGVEYCHYQQKLQSSIAHWNRWENVFNCFKAEKLEGA